VNLRLKWKNEQVMEDNLHQCCCGKDRMCNCYAGTVQEKIDKKLSDPDEKSLIPYLSPAAEIYKLHPLPNHRPMQEVVDTVLKIARLLRDGDSV
jgi:hypothetical protein